MLPMQARERVPTLAGQSQKRFCLINMSGIGRETGDNDK